MPGKVWGEITYPFRNFNGEKSANCNLFSDFIFTKEEHMIENLLYLAPIGHNDNTILKNRLPMPDSSSTAHYQGPIRQKTTTRKWEIYMTKGKKSRWYREVMGILKTKCNGRLYILRKLNKKFSVLLHRNTPAPEKSRNSMNGKQ